MVRPLALMALRNREQLAAEQIYTVQSSTSRIKPEDGDSEFICSRASFGTDSVPSEDESSTAVSSDDRRRMLYKLELQVPSLVLDPAEIAGPIQIADAARFTRRHDCVLGSEVEHPFPAELDRFVVRCSPHSWLRRLSHTSRVHPPSDSRRARLPSSTRAGLVGGKS